jgi:hypothetical protein
MAKKKDNSKYAVLALLLGVGGYFIYKKIKDGGDGNKPDDAPTEEDVVLAVEQAKQAASGQTFSPYQIQVMQLQAWLNIGIDGNAGKQTLGKLDYYWANYGKVLDFDKAKADNYPELRKNGFGLLSPSNISQYIAKLNAGTSPRQTYWKGQATSSTSNTASSTDIARIAAARPIVTAFNSGTSKLLKFTKDASLKQYTQNSSGAFVAKSSFFGSNTLSKRAGSTYKFVSLSVSTTGFILAKAQPISGDAFYVYISPYVVTNA